MNTQFKKIPLGERFYDRILENANGCWIWQRGLDKNGYGRSSINRKGVQAHRVSWVIHKGKIPDGMQVLHRCDNPPCVNPEHLFLGNNADNMTDKMKKNRQTRGHDVNTSKINASDVFRIRGLLSEGWSGRKISKLLGLKDHHVYDIKNGRSWRWLP